MAGAVIVRVLLPHLPAVCRSSTRAGPFAAASTGGLSGLDARVEGLRQGASALDGLGLVATYGALVG